VEAKDISKLRADEIMVKDHIAVNEDTAIEEAVRSSTGSRDVAMHETDSCRESNAERPNRNFTTWPATC